MENAPMSTRQKARILNLDATTNPTTEPARTCSPLSTPSGWPD